MNINYLNLCKYVFRHIKGLMDSPIETPVNGIQSTKVVPELTPTKMGQKQNSPSLNVSKGNSTVRLFNHIFSR